MARGIAAGAGVAGTDGIAGMEPFKLHRFHDHDRLSGAFFFSDRKPDGYVPWAFASGLPGLGFREVGAAHRIARSSRCSLRSPKLLPN